MSEHGYSVKVPQRHLRLVEAFAEREPTAGSPPVVEDGSLPSPGPATWLTDGTQRPVASRSANAVCGEDIVDLAYLSALVLPKLKQAVADLEIATRESDTVETITACRRFVAISGLAKSRADSLERRLP